MQHIQPPLQAAYTCNSYSTGCPKFQGSLSLAFPPGFQSHSLRLEPALLHHLDHSASASGSFPVFESSH